MVYFTKEGLIINSLHMSTFWLYENGIVEEHMGNMEDLGNALKNHLERVDLGDCLGKILNQEVPTPKMLVITRKENPEQISIKSGKTTDYLLSPRPKEYSVDINIPEIEFNLGEDCCRIEPMIQLALESDDGHVKIMVAGDLRFEEGTTVYKAILKGHRLMDLQDNVCTSIGQFISIPGFGKLRYCFHIVAAGTPDSELIGILPETYKNNGSYYLNSESGPKEIKDLHLVQKLEDLYAITEDSTLNYQLLTPRMQSGLRKRKQLLAQQPNCLGPDVVLHDQNGSSSGWKHY